MLGSLDHLGTDNSRKEIRAKERTKLDQQEPEEPSLVKNMHRDRIFWSEEDCVWWSKRKRGNKGFDFLKGNAGFRKGGFALGHLNRVQAVSFDQHKGKGKEQSGKGKGGAYPQTVFSAC